MGLPVTRTLAEIDATVRKAMRGHGCPWGLAEEAGKAARWLASHGLPGEIAMARLTASRDGCCCKPGNAPCALKRATALADGASALSDPVTLDTAHPLVTLAQMGRAADTLDRAFLLDWKAASASVAHHALSIDAHGDIHAPADALSCRAADDVQGTPPSPAARAVDAASWEALDTLARRILVPASDRSRAGAGAGNSDND